MKLFLRISFVSLTIINLIFASFYVFHHDIVFSPDIARDFFILQEIAQKKLILIGPRSSVLGLFHGPLWAYVNFPAYQIGHGNPVAVGWFWIVLLIFFLSIFYLIVKKLFDEVTASLFVLMTSLYSVYQVNGLFNPHGVYFILPIFFYTVIRYVQTNKIQFFIFSVLLAGCMIQFQMAIGIPFFLLSLPYFSYFALTKQKPLHLFSFLLILIPVSTFFLFDLRHHFMMLHFALRQLQQHQTHASLVDLLQDRVSILTSGPEFLRAGPANGSMYVNIAFGLFLLFELWKNPKSRLIYYSFLYFYLGFFVVSLLNRYNLLYFYIFPLFPFVFLLFCSLARSSQKLLFYFLFGIMYAINFVGVIHYLDYANKQIIGKSAYSWKALFTSAQFIFHQKDTSFGYFVYSPDVLAYEPRYAMEYAKSIYTNKTAYTFEKKPVTYLLIAPPPPNNPFMQDSWWIVNQVKITSSPTHIWQESDGYKIERYQLSSAEIQSSFDPAINPGLHFR